MENLTIITTSGVALSTITAIVAWFKVQKYKSKVLDNEIFFNEYESYKQTKREVENNESRLISKKHELSRINAFVSTTVPVSEFNELNKKISDLKLKQNQSMVIKEELHEQARPILLERLRLLELEREKQRQIEAERRRLQDIENEKLRLKRKKQREEEEAREEEERQARRRRSSSYSSSYSDDSSSSSSSSWGSDSSSDYSGGGGDSSGGGSSDSW